MEMNLEVERVLDAQSKLGEGVVWDAQRQVVWFVDIKQNRLWHYDPDTGSNAISEAPNQIGWALPADNGQLLCGLKDGLYTYDPVAADFAKLMDVPGEIPTNRLNDACTDPWGRVWFGSMDDGESDPSGRFYVFDRGTIAPAGPDNVKITNGPAVNKAGTRIYFTDTTEQKIHVAPLSRDGVGEAQLFADTGALFPDAYPDGPIVDAEDHLWTGLYLGGMVARFAPDGQLVATVAMPGRDVTKMVLGGPDFKTAYVTTAIKNMEEGDYAAHPLSGSLLRFQSPVAGFAMTPVALA